MADAWLPMLSFIVTACILWFLLVFFNEDSSYEIQQQQAITISLVMTFVGILVRVAVLFFLPRGFGFVALLVQVLVLYLAVEKFCGYSRRTIWKIVVSYFGLLLIWGMITASLS